MSVNIPPVKDKNEFPHPVKDVHVKREIIGYFKDGLTDAQIAAKLGIPKTRLRKRYKQWELTGKYKRPVNQKIKIPEEDKELIKILYLDGIEIKDLQEKFDLTYYTLNKFIKSLKPVSNTGDVQSLNSFLLDPTYVEKETIITYKGRPVYKVVPITLEESYAIHN